MTLDEPRRGLQEFFAERKRQGMLLALVSKNNEEDVLETFRAHPEMPLALEDFVARRINWEPKSANLASLAAELSLGLDSFILVDDNPKECREAQAAQPEVLAVPLPPDAVDIPAFLRQVWAFDRAGVTAEDLRRSGLYHLEAQRAAARRSAPSLDDFLASLDLADRHRPAHGNPDSPRGPAHPAHQPDEYVAHPPNRKRNPRHGGGMPDRFPCATASATTA